MNLPDSFYIALCMTILLVGAVYWVWTQIQYVQRKVNVLENIVYELKTLCSSTPPFEGGAISPSQQYPPAPPSVLGEDDDLLHQTLRNEIQPIHATQHPPSPPPSPFGVSQEPENQYDNQPELHSEPTFAIHEVEEAEVNTAEESSAMFDMRHFVTQGSQEEQAMESFLEPVPEAMVEPMVEPMAEPVTETSDDLQPGGVGSGIVAPPLQSSLEGMTIKELRRLAQQKGISGATDMKKRELIEAIRAVPIESFLE